MKVSSGSWTPILFACLTFSLARVALSQSVPRVAMLVGSTLLVQERELFASLTREAVGVSQFQLVGDRIGVVEGNTLFVKEGGLSTPWAREADGVSRFQLEGDRIAVLEGGELQVKEGGLSTPWIKEADGVSQFQLAGDRIGVIEGGTLFVKEGGLSTPWVKEANGVSEFRLAGDRIGVLEGGTLFVKEGGLSTPWTQEADGVSQFQLASNRIAVLEGGTLFVKEGGLSTPWIKEADSVSQFQLAGDRIGVLEGVSLFVKEGGLSTPWIKEADGVSRFQLTGDRIAVLEGSRLQVKEGGLSTPWEQMMDCVASFELASLLEQSVLTQHNNNFRTGAQVRETALTPSAVQSRGMQVKHILTVEGTVDAQPLYVRSVAFKGGSANAFYIVTDDDFVYAFDADAGGPPIWETKLFDSNPTQRGLPRGAVSAPVTPVIDLGSQTIYILFSTKNQPVDGALYCMKGSDGTQVDPNCNAQADEARILQTLDVAYWLVALDIRSGTELRRTRVQASVSRDDGSALAFDARLQTSKPALLLDHGSIYLAFGERDEGVAEYHGWVIRYSAAGFRPQGVFCTTANFRGTAPEGGGIWQGGGGLAADADGNIYFLVGNAPANPTAHSYGDSFVKLRPQGDALNVAGSVSDNTNAGVMDQRDLDLGSGGLLVIPGTHLLVGGGKTGMIYLVDGSSMTILQSFQAFTNTYHPSWNYGCPRPVPDECADWDAGPHLHGSPTYWRGRLYAWSEKDYLKQFVFDGSSGRFNTTPLVGPVQAVERSDIMPGGLTSLSANGNRNDTGIIWAMLQGSLVFAFDAESLHQLWRAVLPRSLTASRRAPPTIADGKVAVATGGGSIVVYELGPPPLRIEHRSEPLVLQPVESSGLPPEQRFANEREMATLPALRREQLAPPPGQVVLFRVRSSVEGRIEKFEGGYLAGATWEASDGSRVTAEQVKAVEAPDGHSPAWQILKATAHAGKGRLARVEWIQRIDTDRAGATYVFYGARPLTKKR